MTQLLQRMRNVVKKFYWNHIYNCRVSIQQVPVLRLHSSRIQPLPLKKRITLRVGQNHRHNSHQTHSGQCPTAYRRRQYTHLQGGPRQENDSDAPLINDHSSPLWVFMLYFAEFLSLWCRLRGTVLMRDLLPKLTKLRLKCTDYWAQTGQFYTPFYSTTMK